MRCPFSKRLSRISSTDGWPFESSRASQIISRCEVFFSFFSVSSFCSSLRCFIAARLYVIVRPYEESLPYHPGTYRIRVYQNTHRYSQGTCSRIRTREHPGRKNESRRSQGKG